MEIAPGVYVGKLSKRVRDLLWTTIQQQTRDGQSIMIEPVKSEQHFTIRTTGRDRWNPIEFDGITLMSRPRKPKESWKPSPSQVNENDG